MSHSYNNIVDPLENLFIFAEIGLNTSALQQIDDKHTFNISKPESRQDIVGIPISTSNFQKVFYGTADNSEDGVSFDHTKKATPFSFTRSSTIKDTPNGLLLKSYYNLSQEQLGRYAWSDSTDSEPGLHLEDKVLPVWMNDMGCMDEENLSMSSLVRLKKELHSGEILNCGSYDIYGYRWGEFEKEYKVQTNREFANDTRASQDAIGSPGTSDYKQAVSAGNGANVALDIILSNSNSMAKNILIRISFTVTATGPI
jgi:hypothetical protein